MLKDLQTTLNCHQLVKILLVTNEKYNFVQDVSIKSGPDLTNILLFFKKKFYVLRLVPVIFQNKNFHDYFYSSSFSCICMTKPRGVVRGAKPSPGNMCYLVQTTAFCEHWNNFFCSFELLIKMVQNEPKIVQMHQKIVEMNQKKQLNEMSKNKIVQLSSKKNFTRKNNSNEQKIVQMSKR